MWQNAITTFHHSSNFRGFYKCQFPRQNVLIYWQLPKPAAQNILFHWFDFPPLLSHLSLLLHSLANLHWLFFPSVEEESGVLLWAGKGKEVAGWEGGNQFKWIRGVSVNLKKWFSHMHMHNPLPFTVHLKFSGTEGMLQSDTAHTECNSNKIDSSPV